MRHDLICNRSLAVNDVRIMQHTATDKSNGNIRSEERTVFLLTFKVEVQGLMYISLQGDAKPVRIHENSFYIEIVEDETALSLEPKIM